MLTCYNCKKERPGTRFRNILNPTVVLCQSGYEEVIRPKPARPVKVPRGGPAFIYKIKYQLNSGSIFLGFRPGLNPLMASIDFIKDTGLPPERIISITRGRTYQPRLERSGK